MKRIFLVLLLLASVSFSSLLGQFGTDGEISAKPTVSQNSIVFASDDGYIYSINPNTAKQIWKTFVGKTPNEVFVYDGGLVSSTTSGRVVKISSSGSVQWSTDLSTENVSRIYGTSANANLIFVSTDRGVYALQKSGIIKSKILEYEDSVATAPAAGSNFVIVGVENTLYRITETGVLQWSKELTGGSFWLSRPVIDGASVYIGALDNKMHAYALSNGVELWQVTTTNWVLGTPLVEEGNLYFGSNDGKVYSVSAGTGNVRWKAQTQLGVQTAPESGYMGGREVVFVGGSDKGIYAIATDNGEILWKGSAAGSVGSPLFYLNTVVFGSQDQRIYIYSTERACSITHPKEGDITGMKELEVKGNYVSEAGGASVYVDINGRGWQKAENTEMDWIYYVDPTGMLTAGLNSISCKVVDSGGEETGTTFTSVAINHDPDIPLSKLVVTVSPNIMEGEEFTIFVNDGDDGSPVNRFELFVNGDVYEGDGHVNLTLDNPGSYRFTAKKMGFSDKSVNVNVNRVGVDPLLVGGGIVLILIILYVVWTRLLKQRLRKR